MSDDIGNIKSITGTSMNLNTQPGYGGEKPSASAGTANPGGHKPPRPPEKPIPMPK